MSDKYIPKNDQILQIRRSKIKKWVIGGFVFGFFLTLIFNFEASAWSANQKADSGKNLQIGFFSPAGVDEFIYHVDFSMMNAIPENDPETGLPVINLDHLEHSLKRIKGLNHKLNIDIGPVITKVREVDRINVNYTTEKGNVRTKVFPPLVDNKLLDIVGNNEIERRLKGFVSLVKKYKENIGAIFIADEPYLNGIKRQELERAITKLRALFEREKIFDMQFGLIFAGAMFNAEFARQVEASLTKYVKQIDDYYFQHAHLLGKKSKEAMAFQRWVAEFQKNRITSYDELVKSRR